MFDKTVTSKIVLGNINLDGLKITANKLTYNGEEQEAVTVEGQGNYTLQYRLSETESWKKYDKAAGTVPTVKNAGDYTVYIKAVKDSYNDEEYPEYPLNVHVERAEQSIAFSTAVPTTVELSNDSNKNRYDFSAKAQRHGCKLPFERRSRCARPYSVLFRRYSSPRSRAGNPTVTVSI